MGRRTLISPKVGNRPGPRSLTVGRAFFLEFHTDAERLRGAQWPKTKWQNDPVGFVREELGEEPLEHQAEVMRDVAAGKMCSVKSGTKTGKTKMIVWLALWFYSSFPKARVFFTATTNDQIDNTIWLELMTTAYHAKVTKGFEIVVGATASAGVRSPDGRQILGFTTSNPIAAQGLSGANMLFICDEAAAVKDLQYETIRGNLMGGARLLMVGNPNGDSGPFFESHHGKKHLYSTYTFNSEKIAAHLATLGKRPPPGVAIPEEIEKLAEFYGGKDTAAYRLRVMGEYTLDQNTCIFPMVLILASQEAWKTTVAEGVLAVGCDPAGGGIGGDETVISVVRGKKQIAMYPFRGLNEDGVVAQIRGTIAKHRLPDETPRVLIDSEGPIGSKIFLKLFGIAGVLKATRPNEAYDIYGLKASQPARREPMSYDRLRDEMHANLRDWMKDGGAIITDAKLEGELQLPKFDMTVQGKAKATAKDKIRDKLSRSPDRFDSLMLAVWDPEARYYPRDLQGSPAKEYVSLDVHIRDTGVSDPYDTIDIDPYAGR